LFACEVSGWACLHVTDGHDMLVPCIGIQFNWQSSHIAAAVNWNSLPTQLRPNCLNWGQFRWCWRPGSSYRPTYESSENISWRVYNIQILTGAKVNTEKLCPEVDRG